MLALAFLLLIGVALVADGFDFHIPRGYIYFAMAFAGAVEAVQRAGQPQPAKRTRALEVRRSSCRVPFFLITGGSRGIGAATARLAGARGYDVAVNYKQRRATPPRRSSPR